jgi:hypothetical protein
MHSANLSRLDMPDPCPEDPDGGSAMEGGSSFWHALAAAFAAAFPAALTLERALPFWTTN